jgi:imidazole glycerol-phosphate synthase subunit HisH
VSMPRVGLVDYQAGNLWSIENAFAHIGADVVRITEPSGLNGCSHLVLPGVGAFGFCARSLGKSGLLPSVQEWALGDRRPMLGLCVGMQLLADRSDESPDAAGLGWMGGEVLALPVGDGIRVPHVGWNTVVFESDVCGFRAGDEADFYFDHSFACTDPGEGRRVGYCDHGTRFSAIMERGNVLATQFHPEKSQAAGLKLLAGFLER